MPPKNPKRSGHFPRKKIAAIVKALLLHPRTARGLAKAANISERSAQRWISAFHAVGVVHGSGWAPALNRGVQARIYTLGVGDDVPPPAPMTNAERKRKGSDKSTLERAWR